MTIQLEPRVWVNCKISEKLQLKQLKKLAPNSMKNPGRLLEIGTMIASAAASYKPKAALSTFPYVKMIYQTSEGLYLRKKCVDKDKYKPTDI